MDKIRNYVNSLNYEDYESKEEMLDTVTCELIETAADYDRVSKIVMIALDEREAAETGEETK